MRRELGHTLTPGSRLFLYSPTPPLTRPRGAHRRQGALPTHHTMKHLLLLSALTLLMAACSSGDKQKASETHVADSLTITVAVYPSLDALPLMAANEWGILDSMGMAVKFDIYRSQMDAEKALAAGKADAAMTDMMRTAWWQGRGKPVRFAFATRRPLYMVTNKALRITKANQLDDRMIAISRLSLDDYYCDQVVAQITNRKGQILRPQINSVELRARMLTSGQLDAAVLPQMQYYKVRRKKYKALQTKAKLPEGFAGFAYNTNTLRSTGLRGRSLRLLQKAYNTAAERLIKLKQLPDMDPGTREAIFLDSYLDTIIQPNKDFAKATPPSRQRATQAVQWIKERNAADPQYTGDTLLVD